MATLLVVLYYEDLVVYIKNINIPVTILLMVVSFNGYINALRSDLMSQEAAVVYLESTVIDLTVDGMASY